MNAIDPEEFAALQEKLKAAEARADAAEQRAFDLEEQAAAQQKETTPAPAVVPIPADAIRIVHKTHGAAHCGEEQLDAMKAEGWTVDKNGDGKPDRR